MTSEVHNIDCLEYMRTLPDKAFQLAIADPPYGIRDAGGQTGGSGKLKGRVFNNGHIDRECMGRFVEKDGKIIVQHQLF